MNVDLGNVFAGTSDTTLDYIATSGLMQAAHNAINIQVILQLLVGKGIITRDEVNDMREIVSRNCPENAQFIKDCQARLNRIDEAISFQNTFKDVLSGKDISQEKRKEMNDYLDKINPSNKNTTTDSTRQEDNNE